MAGNTGLFTSYPARFEYEAATFLNLTQVQETSINFGQQISNRFYGGSVDQIASGLRSAEPRVNIRTGDLDTIYDTAGANFGNTGLCVGVNADIPFIERDECGTFKTPATAQHVIMRANGGGFLYVERITGDQEADDGCQASLVFIPHWNGTAKSPLFLVPIQDISAHSAPAFNSMYWPGPVRIANNQELDGVIGWEIDTGIQYGTKRENGEPFPRLGAIRRREFMVRVRVVNLQGGQVHPQTTAPPTPNVWKDDATYKIANLLLSSLAQPSLDIYARKGINCSTRVADATPSHIKFSCALACASADDITQSQTEDGVLTLTFRCLGAPTISHDVAIPAAAAGVDST